MTAVDNASPISDPRERKSMKHDIATAWCSWPADATVGVSQQKHGFELVRQRRTKSYNGACGSGVEGEATAYRPDPYTPERPCH